MVHALQVLATRVGIFPVLTTGMFVQNLFVTQRCRQDEVMPCTRIRITSDAAPDALRMRRLVVRTCLMFRPQLTRVGTFLVRHT